MILVCRNDREVLLERDEFGLRFWAGRHRVFVATEVTLFEFDAGRVPMKSLVDGIGTLTKGGLGVKTIKGGLGVETTKGGLVVKTTEVGADVWDLYISRWIVGQFGQRTFSPRTICPRTFWPGRFGDFF